MKEVYCYQEVESEIAQGETVAFTVHPTLLVRAVKNNPASEVITVSYELCIGSDSIGVFTSEFSNMESLLDAFDIADHEEIWEVVGEP
jgi:hypothetical protein